MNEHPPDWASPSESGSSALHKLPVLALVSALPVPVVLAPHRLAVAATRGRETAFGWAHGQQRTNLNLADDSFKLMAIIMCPSLSLRQKCIRVIMTGLSRCRRKEEYHRHLPGQAQS